MIKEGNIEVKYKYLKIFRVYVTDKDFFFRIDKNISFILPKERIVGMDKFEKFIDKRFQNRFIKINKTKST